MAYSGPGALRTHCERFRRKFGGRDERSPWWRHIHLVAIFALGLRIALALASDNQLHPDELFQYLEQGHGVAFGYGHVPWEYRFGARSWMIPGSIAGLLSLTRALGIDEPYVYIPFVRIVCCVLSISLVYGVYVVGRNVTSESAGRMAAVFAAVWYELIYFAHKATPEVLAAYCFVVAVALAVVTPSPRRAVACGVLCILTVAVRLQYAPAVAVLSLYACGVWSRRNVGTAVASGAVMLVLVGLLDYLTWGSLFASYYNAYLMNSTRGLADIFGVETNRLYYPGALAIVSGGVFAVAAIVCLARLPRTWILLACVASLVLAHTAIGHKEHRFMFAAIPLLLVCTAAVTADVLIPMAAKENRKRFAVLSVCAITAVSLIGFFGALPFQKRVYYQGAFYRRDDIHRVFRHLRHEPDLVAIYNSATPWYLTGGYYYLHREVPIYRREHFDACGRSVEELSQIASHVICRYDGREYLGFATVARYGDIEIRKQISRPESYERLPVDPGILLQAGIDGIYEPLFEPSGLPPNRSPDNVR